MKINWILPEVTQCGGVRVALQYANYLVELGHDVVCYAPKSGQHYGWKRIFFPKEVIRMNIDSNMQGKWFENKFIFKFPLWISNKSIRDADITIATSWITSYWVSELSRKKGKKVYFIQDFETWGGKYTNKLVKKSYKLNFDEIITVSTALYKRLIRECNVEATIVCNGIEECFLQNLGEKDYSTFTLGMPYREIRGDDIKNCALGLRVMEKIKEKYPLVELVSFGFKKPEEWNDTIKFIENPTREELVKIYHDINIFYVPSIYEGWGLPAMEAMAQECCVIASNSGLIEEIGIDKENCIIINDPRDENEVVCKIIDLIEDRACCSNIGKIARKKISSMTQKNSAKKMDNILQNISIK